MPIALDKLSPALEEALERARLFAEQRQHAVIAPDHLLYVLFDDETPFTERFAKFGISTAQILNLLTANINLLPHNTLEPGRRPIASSPLRDLIEKSFAEMEAFSAETVEPLHFILSVCAHSPALANDLRAAGVTRDTLIAAQAHGDQAREVLGPAAEIPANASGKLLAKYTRDLSALARAGELMPVVGREEEIRRVLQILLRKTKSNPVCVGDPGTGKTSIAEGVALRIAAGEVPESLKRCRVLALDLTSLVAGAKYRGEFEERIKGIVDECRIRKGEIILFLDELHTLVGAGGSEGSLDAANILKPALARGELRAIGATTFDGYREKIEKDGALARRFDLVPVKEPSDEAMLVILQGIRPRYEAFHSVGISDDALQASIKLSRRYLPSRFLPDKAIDILDEACARIRMRKESASQPVNNGHQVPDSPEEVLQSHIAEVVADRVGIPIHRMLESERERLSQLEVRIGGRVFGQPNAVAAVSDAVRRMRADLETQRKPNSFLFVGPTGTGKTELAKALADALFDDETTLIRVDMGEYKDKGSLSGLIGSRPGLIGSDEGGYLTERVRRSPYSIVLFDEIEKAHPEVLDLLLAVLDEGRLTDAKGRFCDFSNTVVLFTSNLGSHQAMSASDDPETRRALILEYVKASLRPELLNRISQIVPFDALTSSELERIVALSLDRLGKKLVEEREIELHVHPAALAHLAAISYDPEYGARLVGRIIQQCILSPLAASLIAGEIEHGQKLNIEYAEDTGLTFDCSDGNCSQNETAFA